jgi:chromosome segregation ATPase
MLRRIFIGILILLSAIFLVLSLVGIGAIWYYNEQLSRVVTGQLKEVDRELALAQATLKSSETELQRTLRIVDAAEQALEKLAEQSESAESLFERIQSTLDDRLLPELKTTRARIVEARTTLENLQTVLEGVSSFIPGVDLNLPRATLTNLITSAQSLDAEIANMEVLAGQASIFVADSSYLLGGDLTQTRESLQSFLSAVQEYEKKVDRWRQQETQVLENAPQWIDQASIILTVFLLWFGISQFGLLLHARAMQRGINPFKPWQRPRRHNPLIKDERDLELEE